LRTIVISRLRQRMLDAMAVRNFSDKTRLDYIRHVKNFAAFLGRSPDSASADDLRRFQLHQRQNGVQPASMNSAVRPRLNASAHSLPGWHVRSYPSAKTSVCGG
jgi:site-specific recombinase XerD